MTERARTAELILALGGDQLLVGRHQHAVARFKEAIRLDPLCADAYAWLGRAYKEMGRFEEAEQAFQEAIRIKSDFALAYFHLGLLYVAQGDARKALEQHERLRDVHPARAGQLLEQIRFRERLDRVTERGCGAALAPAGGGGAIVDLQQPRFHPARPETPGADTRRAPDAGAPSNPSMPWIVPAETPATSEPEPAGVAPEAARTIPTPGAASPAVQAAEPPVGRATSPPADAAEPSPALSPELDALRRQAAADPRNAAALWRLGTAYMDAGEFARAAEALEKAIANRVDFGGSHPDSVRESVLMCLRLGLCYERLGRFDDAAGTYDQALDADPEHAEAHLRLGLVMLVLNNRREAVERYRTVARLDPPRAQPLLQRLLRVLAK